MTILNDNRTNDGNFINVSNKESFFKYYAVIKYDQAGPNLSCTLRASLDVITPTFFDHLIKLIRMVPYS